MRISLAQFASFAFVDAAATPNEMDGSDHHTIAASGRENRVCKGTTRPIQTKSVDFSIVLNVPWPFLNNFPKYFGHRTNRF